MLLNIERVSSLPQKVRGGTGYAVMSSENDYECVLYLVSADATQIRKVVSGQDSGDNGSIDPSTQVTIGQDGLVLVGGITYMKFKY